LLRYRAARRPAGAQFVIDLAEPVAQQADTTAAATVTAGSPALICGIRLSNRWRPYSEVKAEHRGKCITHHERAIGGVWPPRLI